jgi:general secretion pathway protein L
VTTLRFFVAEDFSANATYEWVLLDDGRQLRNGADKLAALPAAHRIEVVVPARWVCFQQARIPEGNRRRALTALAYLIEDDLVAPPESVHVVAVEGGAAVDATESVLAVIDKALLKRLLDGLAQAGIRPNCLYPAALLPPLVEGSWAVVHEGGDACVRSAATQGYALGQADMSNPPQLLILVLAEARLAGTAPTQLIVYGELPDCAAWSRALGLPVQAAREPDWKIAARSHEVDLLQGEFAPPSAIWETLKQARPALILVAIALGVSLAGLCIDWGAKKLEERRLDEAMTALFKATFTDATVIVDAPLQMRRKVTELQHTAGQVESGDFLPMLAALSARLGALPADAVRSMAYEKGVLTLHLLSPTREAAQALQGKLAVPGLTPEMGNLKAARGGVEFDLVVKAGNP